jgi:hypothetical protein
MRLSRAVWAVAPAYRFGHEGEAIDAIAPRKLVFIQPKAILNRFADALTEGIRCCRL